MDDVGRELPRHGEHGERLERLDRERHPERHPGYQRQKARRHEHRANVETIDQHQRSRQRHEDPEIGDRAGQVTGGGAKHEASVTSSPTTLTSRFEEGQLGY